MQFSTSSQVLGYFENEDDNLRTIKAIKADLNEFGFGVIDFMNSEFVVDHLVSEDVKTIEGITFHQKRKFESGYIIKNIEFVVNDQTYNFQERVKGLTLKDFELLFEKANVHLLDIFGDYKLRKFDPKQSERLIMIFK